MPHIRTKIAFGCCPFIIGGAEKFLSRILIPLQHKGFDPILLFYGRGVSEKFFHKMGIKTKAFTRSLDILELANETTVFLKKNKISLTQTCSFYPWLAMASVKAGIPHIWRIGGHIDIACPELSSVQKINFLKLIYGYSDLIICNSRFLQQQFKDIHYHKTTVIYNGLDLNEAKTIINKSRLQGPHRFRIMMAGNLISQKRHYDFTKAAKKILEKRQDVEFLMFGSPFANCQEGFQYGKRLIDHIKNDQFKGKIKLVMNNQYLWPELSKADIVVLPSINEGFGNVLLEAMAIGKPVIAADSGGLPELVTHNQTGILVPPKKPKALAQGISKLLEDRKFAQKLGANAMREVQQRFTIQKMVAQYLKAYKKILR